jgi:hypothetical protein
MNQRMIDAAIILYGNNSALRNQLLKEYKVKYLYWESNWLEMEFRFDDKGKIVDFFDPYMIDDTPERAQYLQNNGVKFMQLETWKDPAFKGEDVRKYHVLVVLPSNANITQPWSDELNKQLELAKEVSRGGTPLSRVYKMKGKN